MKIIFLNAWHAKLGVLFDNFVEKHAPTTDVFCFQETYTKVREICTKLIPQYNLIFQEKVVSKEDDFSQATYVKPGISMNQREAKDILENNKEVGMCLYTPLRNNNQIIHLCNMHGLSKPGDKLDTDLRIRQSQGVIDYFKTFDQLVIVGGDFNLELETESVKMFAQNGYRNLIKDFGITNTRNHYVWDKYPETKQYYSDFVFTKNLEVEEFEVAEEEISDHQAMILHFTIK